jgi:uncharacterized coiled-coil DUF342 family protein
VSKNWKDSEFDDLDRRHASSRGRKHERRGQRHDSKHHLKDIKDMVNNGEDIEIDDLIDDLDEE